MVAIVDGTLADEQSKSIAAKPPGVRRFRCRQYCQTICSVPPSVYVDPAAHGGSVSPRAARRQVLTLKVEVLIVGAGHGGAQAAIALRQRKFSGSIGLLGDEPGLPYERPPLSKAYLAGKSSFDRILIRSEKFWHEQDITLLPGRRVVAVNPPAHEVTLADGSTIAYGTLIWSAGGRARRLTCRGADFAGVHTVRTRADVDRISQELPTTERIVVVGGGYIGLETAATFIGLGKHVTVLEALDRVLARVAGEPLSRFYEREHRDHGVEIHLGARVASIEGAKGQATGVRLAGGQFVPAELVVVGIGIVPEVEPLLQAGAAGGNGVEIDELCRTGLPNVFAIGDCALHANRYAAGARVRLESVQNATDQASTVAQFLTGSQEPYRALPWFWSDQYDLKLQTVGLSLGHEEHVIRGSDENRSFSIVYLKGGRVIALDCVNASRDYIHGRALIASGARPEPSALQDAGITLKSLAIV